MTNLLEKIADWLLPKDQNVQLLEALGPAGLVEKLPPAENFDLSPNQLTAIFNYRYPLCRQAIWEIKYRGNKKLIQNFSRLLYDFILEELNDWATFNNFKNPIIVPVPCSQKRRREKGFNQCILIGQELEKLNQASGGQNFTFIPDLLIKKEETVHQARTKNRRQRFENLKNTVSLNPKYQVEGRNIIIIDDVITTGATMAESLRVLGDAGVKKVKGVALAH